MLRKVNSLRAVDYWFCLLSAVLLALPFNNGKLLFFSWFGFVPLFFVLEGKSRSKAFLFSYFTGIIFWIGTIYWLVHVTLLGTVLLILYLSLYFGFFGLIIAAHNPKPTTYCLLFIPSLWVALEYSRSHLLTGFPWALLGYSQYLNLPVIQSADIAGVWGISFLIVAVNAAIYLVFGLKKPTLQEARKVIFLAVILLAIVFSYGYFRINLSSQTGSNSYVKQVKLSVVQPNIPQELKWNTRSRALIMQRYFELTDKAVKDNPDLVIWPEAALPVVLEEEPGYYLSLQDYVRKIRRPLLFGSVTLKGNLYYNSALLISGNADLLKQYDKLHLVPFGEYIPFRRFLRFLDTIAPIGDIAGGKDYAIFKFPADFGVLICFEDVFPELARDFVKRGAKFLVNITNDAWFGKTSEACQHLAASVFRAIENRVYLVRSANTGISAFISPLGKIVSLLSDEKGNNIFIQGYKTEEIYIFGRTRSFYNRYGDFLPVGCLLFLIFVIINIPHENKR